MNLWVNRLRQLLFPAVALFFFSCEEEITFLGFKNPNNKFENYTVEIPLNSRVLWMDSVRTSNYYVSNDVNRLLVGKNVDPELGTVTSTAAGRFFWVNGNKLPAGAQLISAELHLAFDLYFYGPETAAEQTFTVYKVEGGLSDIPRSKFVSKTPVQLVEEPAGTVTRIIDPPLIREKYIPPTTTPPTQPQPDTLKIPLNESFYGELWQDALNWSINGDSTYSFFKPAAFFEKYKGLAIRPGESNTLMVGFSPASFTQIVLRYQAGDTKGNLILRFYSDFITYNQIVPDYTGTSLEGITYNTDFTPANGLRYMQSGTGLATKISLDNFFAFADTVGPNMIINEARLFVEGLSSNGAFPPPSGFILRPLESNNLVTKLPGALTPGTPDSELLGNYRGLLAIDLEDPRISLSAIFNSDYSLATANDNRGLAVYSYDATDNRYAGSASLFLQQVYRNRENPRWTEFAMVPVPGGGGPSSLKSVNRAVFPADQVKLIIKYTKPTLAE